MLDALVRFWPYLAILSHVVVSASVSIHILLYKRDSRAAIGWIGLTWFSPAVGAILYFFFGINRLRRRAARLRAPAASSPGVTAGGIVVEGADAPPGTMRNLAALAKMTGEVTGVPLVAGNRVEPLVQGEAAYPAMIEAIETAERSIGMETFIFDHDRAGRRFSAALAAAVRRGVEVRVLIDGVGARFSRPTITGLLRQREIPCAEFLASRLPWRNPYLNLRNHRKILVVDGRTGFTGGMNIREGNMLTLDTDHPVRDLHFRVRGPVVRHLGTAFAEDWLFTTGERLEGDAWFPAHAPAGPVAARGIPDGPDDDFEFVRWTILAALAEAEKSVRIVNPYFLPDQSLITALNVAALRGVEVDIVVPEENNQRIVHWAMWAQMWQVIERGCRVWLSEPPFDHTKLMLVDGNWAMMGSANWDPRSLRLNFEFNLECFDAGLTSALNDLVEEKIGNGRRVGAGEPNARPLPVKLRDSVARLFSPYI
jgi:cardiolipin synthase